VKAQFQIGMIQLRTLFDLDGALASFRAIEEHVQSIPALRHEVRLRKGEVFLARGDTAGARREFLAVASAPDALPDHQDEAQLHAAEVEFFAGDFDEAARRLDSITVNLKADYANDALRLQTFLEENATTDSSALLRYARAELYARQRRMGEAIALLQQVVRDHPGAALIDDAMLRIGMLLDETGQCDEAVATYREILTRFAETSIVLDRAQFSLAEAYEFGLHRIPEAMAAYEKLLVDYPSSVFAGIARRRIRILRGDIP
jgi:tetratricopeptide (TPR) repeat protein